MVGGMVGGGGGWRKVKGWAAIVKGWGSRCGGVRQRLWRGEAAVVKGWGSCSEGVQVNHVDCIL